MPKIGNKIGVQANLSIDAALEGLTDSQKRSLALKMLEDTGGKSDENLKIAEQERASASKLEMAQRDEENRQRNEKHYWCQIDQRGPEDSETHVFVGAAGVSYWIQKNVPVPLPLSVLNVLDNATVLSHISVTDEALGVKYVKKVKFKRYPYSRLEEATPDQVTKFRAEQDAARKAAEDVTIGQEMAKSQLIRESTTSHFTEDPPYVPAFLAGETAGPPSPAAMSDD